MKILKIATITLFICCANYSYAEDAPTVTGGAKRFDWETCVNAKGDECKNACATSVERNCPDTCESLARDKCITEGLSPPVTQALPPE